jgi:hypothetical protein
MSGLIVEWERLELKRGWNPLSVVHTLCAFANDFHNLGGGFVLIGVAECPGQPKPMVVGLSAFEVDAIQKEILQLGNCAIRPPYHPAIAPYQIDGRTVLVIWALGGQARPYKARLSLGKDGRDWGYFIRKGSSTVRAKERDELELMSLAATVPFDDRINLRARVDDLSRDLIRAFLRETRSDLAAHADTRSTEDLGRQLRVLSGPAEAMFPVISPDELIVLSYPGPDRSVRLAQLRAGRAVPRRYRNRRIGEFLKELKLTEGRGVRHRVGTKSAPSGDSAQMHGRHRDRGSDEHRGTSRSKQIPKSDPEAPDSGGAAADDHSGKAQQPPAEIPSDSKGAGMSGGTCK